MSRRLDTKEELAIEGSEACESAAYVSMTISTPISLTPCIKELPITVSISGDPVIEPTGCGKFILTQELCVKVPIEITIESND